MDPRPAYAGADLVVGMGSSALRALAIGRPLIVQGEDAFSEIFEPQTYDLFLKQGFYGLGDKKPGAQLLARQIRRPRCRCQQADGAWYLRQDAPSRSASACNAPSVCSWTFTGRFWPIRRSEICLKPYARRGWRSCWNMPITIPAANAAKGTVNPQFSPPHAQAFGRQHPPGTGCSRINFSEIRSFDVYQATGRCGRLLNNFPTMMEPINCIWRG